MFTVLVTTFAQNLAMYWNLWIEERLECEKVASLFLIALSSVSSALVIKM